MLALFFFLLTRRQGLCDTVTVTVTVSEGCSKRTYAREDTAISTRVSITPLSWLSAILSDECANSGETAFRKCGVLPEGAPSPYERGGACRQWYENIYTSKEEKCFLVVYSPEGGVRGRVNLQTAPRRFLCPARFRTCRRRRRRQAPPSPNHQNIR